MPVHLTAPRGGFASGVTEITRFDEPDATGIAMAVLKLRGGEVWEERAASETAYLLLDGEIELGGAMATRRSLFDDRPTCLHVAAGEEVRFAAQDASELMLFRAQNDARFPKTLYLPDDVRHEDRGRGQVGDTCHRIVRTVFDRSNAADASRLVLGEVVNLPGRWSSYPPHHHPQPEMYHYRFQPAQGWGHAELGDDVWKVKNGDTVKIFDGKDHPQCAAPGYAMWYAWVIRHLPGRPYNVPEFSPEHKWVMEPNATWWRPK
jgi:5-deoxy-glucuronate isomerase